MLPTPAVAYLTSAYDADFGVMISASHNPMPDNGIKIFGPGGHKLDDATEDQIEDLVAAGPGLRPVGAGLGRRDRRRGRAGPLPAPGRQGDTVRLNGLTVVVDCAHGAASVAAPRAYRAAGAARHRDQRRTQRPEHQRRLRVDTPGCAAVGGAGPRRRPRSGARR